MEEFKKELKSLLKKYDVEIFVEQEEDDSFLYLQIKDEQTTINIDSGYRDLSINQHNLITEN